MAGFEKNSTIALRYCSRRPTYEKVRLAPRALRRLIFELFSKPAGCGKEWCAAYLIFQAS